MLVDSNRSAHIVERSGLNEWMDEAGWRWQDTESISGQVAIFWTLGTGFCPLGFIEIDSDQQCVVEKDWKRKP